MGRGNVILFNWFKKTPKKPGLLGLALSPDGIALAYSLEPPAASDASATPSLKIVEFIPCENKPEALLKALRAKVEALGLLGAPCNLVLATSEYQLLLAEAPNVPAAELREAIRWRVRDLINFPVDEAVIDATRLPADAGRGGQAMAYVVAIREARLVPVIDLINEAGLYLSAIDIEEMALRNLAELVAEPNRCVALVHIRPGGGVISMVREGSLYLARRFDLDYAGGLLDDLPEDQLALDLQRSLDYFERQMGQAPPSCIYLCGENITEDKITQGLRNSVAAPVKLLPLENWAPDALVEEASLLQLCATAMGGALRAEDEADA